MEGGGVDRMTPGSQSKQQRQFWWQFRIYQTYFGHTENTLQLANYPDPSGDVGDAVGLCRELSKPAVK